VARIEQPARAKRCAPSQLALAWVHAAFPKGATAGERYAAGGMAAVNR